MEFTIPRYLAVMDYDGGATYVKMLHFLVTKENFDLQKAIKAACTDYCNTDGSAIYLSNGCCFNYGDFDDLVPEEICRRHGFVKVASLNTTEVSFFNDHLVFDDQVLCSGVNSTGTKLFYIFPPLDGEYHIWNYTVQWLTDAERTQQDSSFLIHPSMEEASLDERIRKDTAALSLASDD